MIRTFLVWLMIGSQVAYATDAPLFIDGKPLILNGVIFKTFVPDTTGPELAPADVQFVLNGAAFSWTPTQIQGDPGSTTFSQTGKPSWVTLNTATGNLSGTAQTGVSNVLLTATIGSKTFTQLVRIHSYAHLTTVDASWLSSHGPPPYPFTTNNELYRFTTDATSDITFGGVTGHGVGIDLNGHAARHDQATPVTIPDSGFEQVDDWSFANAANASQYTGSYLTCTLWEGTKSLRFDCPTANNQYVQSNGTITLQPNTHYALTFWYHYGTLAEDRPTMSGTVYAKLVGTGGETTITASKTGDWYHTQQMIVAEFTTGSGTPTYHVQVGITGGSGNSVDAYVDTVAVQRSRADGFFVNPQSWAPTESPDITFYGAAYDCTIANGSIIGGSDKGYYSRSVMSFQGSNLALINLDVTTTGKSSCSVDTRDQNTAGQIHIANCTFDNQCDQIANRDYFDGAIVRSASGIFEDNTIVNGPHAGYAPGPSVYGDITGRRNTIQLQAKYTNAFALMASGDHLSDYYDNTISNGSGNYTSRGIGCANVVNIHDNQVTTQQLANIQEYGGLPLGGAYALQIEDHEGGRIHDNVWTLTGAGGGACWRIGPFGDEPPYEPPTEMLEIDHDTGIVNVSASPTGSTGEQHPACVKAAVVDFDLINFHDNHAETNCHFFHNQGSNTHTFNPVRLYLRYHDTGVVDDYPYICGWDDNTGDNVASLDVKFTDADLDAATDTYLDQNARNDVFGLKTTNTSIVMENNITMTITAAGVPVANTAVTVVDNQGNMKYNSTTNGSGIITFIAKDWDRINGTRHEFNPHTVTVSGHSPVTADLNYEDNQFGTPPTVSVP